MFNNINEGDFYFTKENYDVFFKDNISLNTNDLQKGRLVVQDKLLKLHKKLLPEIQKRGYNIHPHYIPKCITSLPYPHLHNNFKLNWIGLRYGQDPAIINSLKLSEVFSDKSDESYNDYGFLKFECFQVNVVYEGIVIGIFHSNPEDSFDRGYLKEHLVEDRDTILENHIVNNLVDLRFLNLQWNCNGQQFDLDKDNPQHFADFYSKNGLKGYSTCTILIPRWDIRILESNLVQTIMYYIDLLYPLFDTIRWKSN